MNLRNFYNDQCLESSTLYPISNVKYTFQSKQSGCRSLIDHILVSANMRNCVKSSNPIDSVENNSDHIAINLVLDMNCE